jgi:hypothetical protein
MVPKPAGVVKGSRVNRDKSSGRIVCISWLPPGRPGQALDQRSAREHLPARARTLLTSDHAGNPRCGHHHEFAHQCPRLLQDRRVPA